MDEVLEREQVSYSERQDDFPSQVGFDPAGIVRTLLLIFAYRLYKGNRDITIIEDEL